MTRCLVSLGSNQGDPDAQLDAAEEGLLRLAEPGSYRSSKRLTTTPLGGPEDQGQYRNAAALFQTRFSAADLLVELQRLEAQQERDRTRRWDARSLDLDLLLYGGAVLDTPDLRVPHPRMTFRPFVLEPACLIAGEWIHPEGGMSLHALWRRLHEGDDLLALTGKGEGAALARSLDESLENPAFRLTDRIDADEKPKLTIVAEGDPEAAAPEGPRLALADCPREHWREEILAAIQCAWPSTPA